MLCGLDLLRGGKQAPAHLNEPWLDLSGEMLAGDAGLDGKAQLGAGAVMVDDQMQPIPRDKDLGLVG